MYKRQIYDGLGEYIAKTGGEVGATTGRPRRCGWFDAVLMKRIIQTNSISGLCLTKIDVLDGLDEIKICKAYEDSDDSIFGECMNLDNVKPIYESLSGWESPTKNLTIIKSYQKRQKISFLILKIFVKYL